MFPFVVFRKFYKILGENIRRTKVFFDFSRNFFAKITLDPLYCFSFDRRKNFLLKNTFSLKIVFSVKFFMRKMGKVKANFSCFALYLAFSCSNFALSCFLTCFAMAKQTILLWQNFRLYCTFNVIFPAVLYCSTVQGQQWY